jgi:hypothetical protein
MGYAEAYLTSAAERQATKTISVTMRSSALSEDAAPLTKVIGCCA